MFMKIYRDTILKLNERGYLFEDDPELNSIQNEIKTIDPIQPLTQPLDAITLPADALIQQEMLPSEAIKSEEPASEGESESVFTRWFYNVRPTNMNPLINQLLAIALFFLICADCLKHVSPLPSPASVLRICSLCASPTRKSNLYSMQK